MEPTRCCIACRKRNEKNKLIRIVADKNNNAIYDDKQNINSRAMYICRNIECLRSLKKCINKSKFKSKVCINNESFVRLIDKLEIEVGE